MKQIVRHIVILLLLAALPGTALSQGSPISPSQRIQLGVGAVPGIGVQAGYVHPTTYYTTEGALYVDVTPAYSGGEGSVQTSLGLGGSIRPLALVRLFSNAPDSGSDLDVGLRFGPSLFFAFNETKASKNQRFSLFLEPYVRFTSHLKGGKTFFVEGGVQRPLLRAGFWLELP